MTINLNERGRLISPTCEGCRFRDWLLGTIIFMPPVRHFLRAYPSRFGMASTIIVRPFPATTASSSKR